MATVGYTLKCAHCGYMNTVTSDGALVIMWSCSNDGNVNITSLPATATGQQQTNPLASITIIPQVLLATISNIIQGIGL